MSAGVCTVPAVPIAARIRHGHQVDGIVVWWWQAAAGSALLAMRGIVTRRLLGLTCRHDGIGPFALRLMPSTATVSSSANARPTEGAVVYAISRMLIGIGVVAFGRPAFCADIDYSNFVQVQAAAWRGDYQAIRNLAYGFADSPMKGQKRDAVQACAWYQALQYTGNPKVGIGDYGNTQVYCSKLSPGDYAKAAPMSLEILRKLPRSW